MGWNFKSKGTGSGGFHIRDHDPAFFRLPPRGIHVRVRFRDGVESKATDGCHGGAPRVEIQTFG